MENFNKKTVATPAAGSQFAPPEQSAIAGTSNPLKKVVIALVALLIVGVGTMAFLNLSKERPPELQLASGESGLKGSFVETSQNLLQFEQFDKDAFAINKPSLAAKYSMAASTLPGVNYLFADSQISMADVVKGIDPVANRLLLAYYTPGEGNLTEGFYTYPKGPFNGTHEISQAALTSFMIPQNRVVVVISEMAASSYGLLNGTAKPSAMWASAPLADTNSGWVLVASKEASLAALTASYKDRVISAFALSGQDTFQQVDPATYSLSSNSVVWLHLRPKVAVTGGTTGGTETVVVVTPLLTMQTGLTLKAGEQLAVNLVGTNLAGGVTVTDPSADSKLVISGKKVAVDGKSFAFIVNALDSAPAATPFNLTLTTADNVAHIQPITVTAKSTDTTLAPLAFTEPTANATIKLADIPSTGLHFTATNSNDVTKSTLIGTNGTHYFGYRWMLTNDSTTTVWGTSTKWTDSSKFPVGTDCLAALPLGGLSADVWTCASGTIPLSAFQGTTKDAIYTLTGAAYDGKTTTVDASVKFTVTVPVAIPGTLNAPTGLAPNSTTAAVDLTKALSLTWAAPQSTDTVSYVWKLAKGKVDAAQFATTPNTLWELTKAYSAGTGGVNDQDATCYVGRKWSCTNLTIGQGLRTTMATTPGDFTWGVQAYTSGTTPLTSTWTIASFTTVAAAPAGVITDKGISTDTPKSLVFTSPLSKQTFTIEALKASGLTFAATDPNTTSFNKDAAGKFYMNYAWDFKSAVAGSTDLWSAGWSYDATKMSLPASCITSFATSNSGLFMTCPNGTIPKEKFANITAGDYVLTGYVGDGKNNAATPVTITVSAAAVTGGNDGRGDGRTVISNPIASPTINAPDVGETIDMDQYNKDLAATDIRGFQYDTQYNYYPSWTEKNDVKTVAKQKDVKGTPTMNYRWKLVAGSVNSNSGFEKAAEIGPGKTSVTLNGPYPEFTADESTQIDSKDCIKSLTNNNKLINKTAWTCDFTNIPMSFFDKFATGDYTFGVQVSDGVGVSDWSLNKFHIKNYGNTKEKKVEGKPLPIVFVDLNRSELAKASFDQASLKQNGLDFTATDPNKESFNQDANGRFYMNYTWELRDTSGKLVWTSGSGQGDWKYDKSHITVQESCITDGLLSCPYGSIPGSFFPETLVGGTYTLTGYVGDGHNAAATDQKFEITGGVEKGEILVNVQPYAIRPTTGDAIFRFNFDVMGLKSKDMYEGKNIYVGISLVDSDKPDAKELYKLTPILSRTLTDLSFGNWDPIASDVEITQSLKENKRLEYIQVNKDGSVSTCFVTTCLGGNQPVILPAGALADKATTYPIWFKGASTTPFYVKFTFDDGAGTLKDHFEKITLSPDFKVEPRNGATGAKDFSVFYCYDYNQGASKVGCIKNTLTDLKADDKTGNISQFMIDGNGYIGVSITNSGKGMLKFSDVNNATLNLTYTITGDAGKYVRTFTTSQLSTLWYNMYGSNLAATATCIDQKGTGSNFPCYSTNRDKTDLNQSTHDKGLNSKDQQLAGTVLTLPGPGGDNTANYFYIPRSELTGEASKDFKSKTVISAELKAGGITVSTK